MRLSRSVPEELMLRENSTCFSVRVLGFCELLAKDENRIERRAQLVRHVGQKLGLVLRGERQLGGLFLQLGASLLDLGILALDLGILLREQPGLVTKLLVGLLEFALARLQLDGELLRLRQQTLGAHRRLDCVEHNADAEGKLIQEREVDLSEGLQRCQFDDSLRLSLKENRQHDDTDLRSFAET